MPKVIYTSKNPPEGPHISMLAEAGFDLSFPPADLELFNEDNLIGLLKDADAVIAGSEPYTPRVIAALPKLRVIARTGVGFDAVNLAACDQAGIPVCTTPGVNHHAVAEHTIALLMAVARGFPELDRKVRKNEWSRTPTARVMGRTIGILGLGRIGQAVATRAVGLGMKVLAYEPYPNHDFVQQWNVGLTEVEPLLKQADYVSLHLPVNEQTKHVINRERLALMKPGAILINTARGPLVNEADLYEALHSRHLRGAGLDVFEVEPLTLASPLLKLDNVLLSGHVAGMDIESLHDTNEMAARIVIDLYNGRWPEGCVQNLRDCTGWKW